MKNEQTEQVPAASTLERKTAELCGHERDGARCMRHRGHADRHESLFAPGQDVLRWD